MTEPDTIDPHAVAVGPSPSRDTPRSRRCHRVVLVRWGGWFVPVALFAWFYDVRMLDVTRAFPLMSGDWALYITAPNFVREAPWISVPIGRLPEYMAPVGTWLGQTDSWPALYPLYRALAVAMPHRPFQLIGWQLLGSLLATFGITRWYLRGEVRAVLDGALRAELAATAGAVALVAQPFYLLRAGHPALFQMWVVPWALIVTSRTLEARRSGDRDVPLATFLAPIAVATALNPYLAIMLLPCTCLPVLLTAPGHARDTARRVGGALAVFGAGSFVFGFVGTGGRPQSEGFGLFMADAALLVDGGRLSRTWPNVPPDLTYEGNGFMGTALLLLAGGVAVAVAVRSRRGRAAEPRLWLWPMWVGVVVALIGAMLPVIRVFDHPVIDLNEALSPLSSVTAVVRANGRLAWPFVWMIGLFSVRHVARQRHVAAHVLLAAVAVFQVVDATRPHIPVATDHYGPAMAIAREASATGITRIEFQPPIVWTDCPAPEWGSFDAVAQLVAAGAVEGLASNSGYPARGSDEFRRQICEDQRSAYLAGRLESHVLYVIPAGAEPVSSELACRLTELSATVCRLADSLPVEASAG